jgi:uroporphyrinogen decarboxylase
VPVERPADPAACPALGPPPFALTDDWAGRPLPDVSRAGRLPLMAEVCSLAHQRLGTRTVVRGALTGPWTLASALVDQTDLLCALRDDPAAVLRLLDWCARLAAAYGERLASGGAALAVFDSRLAPPLVPPAVLGAWLPLYQRLFAHLAAVSRRPVALVVGGNTGSIAPLLADCGAGELLCDAGAPVAAWLDSCAGQGRSLRVNLARDAWDDPRPALARLATANHGRPGLVVGTGVVGVADDPRMIAAIRTHLTETAWT